MSNNTEVHFEGKIAQKAIIIDGNNNVLLVRDPRMEEVVWEIPGGRMNVDEEPREAVAREIMEELGVVIEVGEVVHMEQFFHVSEGKRAFVIVYKASLVDSSKLFSLDNAEISEIAWVSQADLLNYPLFPEYKNALDYYFEKYAK